MRRLLLILPFLLMFSSCSTISDYFMRAAGYSMTKFDDEKKGRFDKTFEMKKKDAFDKTLNIIKDLRARVTHKSYSKGYIVAFDFPKSFDYCLDSTEAAFFIEEEPGGMVKTTVVSDNSLLAKILADKYFTLMAAPQEQSSEEKKIENKK